MFSKREFHWAWSFLALCVLPLPALGSGGLQPPAVLSPAGLSARASRKLVVTAVMTEVLQKQRLAFGSRGQRKGEQDRNIDVRETSAASCTPSTGIEPAARTDAGSLPPTAQLVREPVSDREGVTR
uniref:Uncharacterized protein n=1 Tax=Molossus molossus TaxID=27622 RepID=A0A7J8BLH2_MOLMO|nr:hypothetical protein HJG59_010183 [Molossus molossus]